LIASINIAICIQATMSTALESLTKELDKAKGSEDWVNQIALHHVRMSNYFLLRSQKDSGKRSDKLKKLVEQAKVATCSEHTCHTQNVSS
jgi:hypothetical protein